MAVEYRDYPLHALQYRLKDAPWSLCYIEREHARCWAFYTELVGEAHATDLTLDEAHALALDYVVTEELARAERVVAIEDLLSDDRS